MGGFGRDRGGIGVAEYLIILQKKLRQRQRRDARKTEKSRNDDGYGIDRKGKSREGCNGIEQPKTEKSADGIDADFPKPADGQRDQPQQKKDEQQGNNESREMIHKYLRIDRRNQGIITVDTEPQSLKERDDGSKKGIVHLLSSVSP